MRFQPIIVPKPKAMATATLTQVGMNLVEWSSCFLYAPSVFLVGVRYVQRSSDLAMKRSPSLTKYMSLRMLTMEPGGTLSIEW